MTALMSIFVDIEHTGESMEFEDKFGIFYCYIHVYFVTVFLQHIAYPYMKSLSFCGVCQHINLPFKDLQMK